MQLTRLQRTRASDLRRGFPALPALLFALLAVQASAGGAEQASGDSCAEAASLSLKTGSTTGVVRLRPNVLINSVLKRLPITPPTMLHDTSLHGKVILDAYVNESGHVVGIKPLKGHPLATASAVSSVRGWTFRPYQVKGIAQCVVGTIAVDYDFRSRTPERADPH